MPQSNHPTEAGNQPASSPHFLVLGRILRPHGVRGELRLQVITDYPERIADLDSIFIGRDPFDPSSAIEFGVVGARRHREQMLVRLEGITNRDDVEPYRGQLLMVALDDAVPLEDNEYYVFQIIGASVVTTDGEDLGKVQDVLETGANDVFVVRGGIYGEVLIPDIPDVVLEISPDTTRITVALPPGLIQD